MHEEMMCRRMMFVKIISIVILPFVPVDSEFVVCAFIAQPVPSHVPCFGPALLDVSMNKAVGGGIISLDWGGLLWMTKSTEGNLANNGFLGIAVDAAGLCFGSRAHDSLYCFADGQNRTVGRRSRFGWEWGWMGTKEIMASIPATSVGEYQVCGIGINVESHVAGMVPDDGRWVGGGVIHEHFAGKHGFLGGRSLGAANCVDGWKHGWVYSLGVVE